MSYSRSCFVRLGLPTSFSLVQRRCNLQTVVFTKKKPFFGSARRKDEIDSSPLTSPPSMLGFSFVCQSHAETRVHPSTQQCKAEGGENKQRRPSPTTTDSNFLFWLDDGESFAALVVCTAIGFTGNMAVPSFTAVLFGGSAEASQHWDQCPY